MTDTPNKEPHPLVQQLEHNAIAAGFPDVESHWAYMARDFDLDAFLKQTSELHAPAQLDQSTQQPEPGFDEAAELADLNATYWGFNTADDLKQWGVDMADDRPAQASTDQGVVK